MDCLLLDMLDVGEPCSGVCSQHAAAGPSPRLVNTGCGVMCCAKELEQEVAALEAEAQWDLAQEDTLDTLLSCDTGMHCRGYCQTSYPDESADSDDPEREEEGAEEDVEGGYSCAITANADAVATGRGVLRVGAWRGCLKSPWCDREDRHRGLCNRKATIPGPASITGSHADTSTPPDTPLAAAAADEPFGLQHQQSGDATDSHPAAAAAAATSDQVSAGHHSHNLRSANSLGSDDTEVASALKTAPSDGPSSDMSRGGCAPLALLPLLDALDDPPEPFWALPDPDCYTGGSPLDDVEGMCDLQQHMQLQLEQQRHQQQQSSLALRQRAEEEPLGLETSGSEAGTALGSCHSSPQRPALAAQPLLVASVAQKPLGACLLLLPPTSLVGVCSSTRPSRPEPALCLAPVATQPAELPPVAPPHLSMPAAATPAPCAPPPAPEPAACAAPMPVLEAPLAVTPPTAAAPTPASAAAPATAAAAAAQPGDASRGGRELGQCGSSEGGSGSRSLRPASARVPKRSLDTALEEAVVVPVKKKPAHKSASAPHGHCCTQCGTSTTPVWRAGPAGPKTLCNACGVRFMKIAKRKA